MYKYKYNFSIFLKVLGTTSSLLCLTLQITNSMNIQNQLKRIENMINSKDKSF